MSFRIHPAWLIVLLISLLLNGVLGYFLFSCQNGKCPDAVITKQWSDTVYVDLEDIAPVQQVADNQVKPVKVIHLQDTIKSYSVFGFGKAKCVSEDSACGPVGASSSPCPPDAGIYIFSREFDKVNDYSIELVDSFQNNTIIGSRLIHYNLKPFVNNYTEKTIPQREKVQVFIGAFGGFARPYNTTLPWNWTIGPEVFIQEPHGIMVGYGFDAKNNGHQVHLNYKIKLK